VSTREQGWPLRQRNIDVHFSVPKDNATEADPNTGTLVVFNMDSSITCSQVMELFSRFGEVKEIRSTPHKDGHKFVEFYDSRHATAALQGDPPPPLVVSQANVV
jgi:RNA recognition motif-containing protein